MEHSGLVQACNGTALPLNLIWMTLELLPIGQLINITFVQSIWTAGRKKFAVA